MSGSVVGAVNPNGTVLPNGIYDMAELGQDLVLDPQIENKLQDLYGELGIAAGREVKAKYKLEFVVGSKGRSKKRHFPGIISAWTNDGFAHGGGDEAVYFCTGKVERKGQTKTCNAPLELVWISKDHAVCPVCKSVLDPEKLTGQIFANLTMQNWAVLILRCFEVLHLDADIRMKTIRGDLRRATEIEQNKYQAGDHLHLVRASQEWVIYPLKNILKDTAAGATLYTRLRSFLEA